MLKNGGLERRKSIKQRKRLFYWETHFLLMDRAAAVLVLVSLLGGCLCTGGGDSSQEYTLSSTTSTQVGGESIADIAAAIASGAGYKCTYSSDGTYTETYIKGDRYHSMMDMEGTPFHSLSDGVWSYSWIEGQDNGFKLRLSDLEEFGGSVEGKGYSDMDDAVKYATDVDCVPAQVGDEMLEPPSDVSFVDMSEMLGLLGGGLDEDESGGNCGFCDMIPDEAARQQCLSSC